MRTLRLVVDISCCFAVVLACDRSTTSGEGPEGQSANPRDLGGDASTTTDEEVAPDAILPDPDRVLREVTLEEAIA